MQSALQTAGRTLKEERSQAAQYVRSKHNSAHLAQKILVLKYAGVILLREENDSLATDGNSAILEDGGRFTPTLDSTR